MNNNHFSKETLWAVSVIMVSIIAGCFLFFRNIKSTSVPAVLLTENETIIINDVNTKKLEFTLSDTVSDTNNIISASTNSSMEMETINSNTNESLTETLETDSNEFSAETLEADSNEFSAETLEADSNEFSAETLEAETSEFPTDIPYDCPIDFEALWETNEDVYAWISVPGTVIDYPILQHDTDNSYYLNYTIDGIEGYPGSIYTENVNSKDFTDNNTVIYGHNMRNGTMFTDLHKFRDADFFNEHDTVYIYTPQKQFTYKIFAAYLYDDRHLMNSFDFSNETVFADYLTEIQSQEFPEEHFREDITVTGSDKIITLITCIREQPEKRVYVQAVLLPDTELTP